MIKKFFLIIFVLILSKGYCFPNSGYTINSDKIEYDIKADSIKTYGYTELKNSKNQKIITNGAYYNKENMSLDGNNLELYLGENVYIKAETIYQSKNNIVSKNANFTACHNCDDFGDAWKISTSKIFYDKDKHYFNFYNPIFWIYKIPILWLPFFSYPDPTVKHKSGFLLPTIKSTNNMGEQLNIPLYLYISDNQDLTFNFSYITREKPLYRLEHRLNLEHSQFRSEMSFTKNSNNESRWHFFNKDIVELGENARLKFFLERVSDKSYLQKYNFYKNQPFLDSGLNLELFDSSSYIFSDIHIFQDLREEDYRFQPNNNIIPNLHISHKSSPIFYKTFGTFTSDLLNIKGISLSNQRLVSSYSITSPWVLFGGNILTLNSSIRYDLYNFENIEMFNNTIYSGIKTRFVPSGYIELKNPLIKVSNDKKYIIEPRLRLNSIKKLDDFVFAKNNDSSATILSDTTLFADNRFSGMDIVEDGIFADYAINFRFINNKNNLELFTGQSYNFTGVSDINSNIGFHKGISDYVGRLVYAYDDVFSLSNRLRLSKSDLSLMHTESSLVVGKNNNYINIGYILESKPKEKLVVYDYINELNTGFGIQIMDRLSLKFNSIYTITEDKFRRYSASIYYNHPCYFISLEYRYENIKKDDYVGNTSLQLRFGLNINGSKL